MRIPTPETMLRLRVPCAAWAAMAATGVVGAAHAQTGLVNW